MIGPLPDFGACGEHADASFASDFDGRDRREHVFAGPGEAGAVHEGREPDALPSPPSLADLSAEASAKAEALTAAFSAAKLSALLVIVRERQRAIEDRAHVHRIADDLPDRADLARA